jgi:hypothetical protein
MSYSISSPIIAIGTKPNYSQTNLLHTVLELVLKVISFFNTSSPQVSTSPNVISHALFPGFLPLAMNVLYLIAFVGMQIADKSKENHFKSLIPSEKFLEGEKNLEINGEKILEICSSFIKVVPSSYILLTSNPPIPSLSNTSGSLFSSSIFMKPFFIYLSWALGLFYKSIVLPPIFHDIYSVLKETFVVQTSGIIKSLSSFLLFDPNTGAVKTKDGDEKNSQEDERNDIKLNSLLVLMSLIEKKGIFIVFIYLFILFIIYFFYRKS